MPVSSRKKRSVRSRDKGRATTPVRPVSKAARKPTSVDDLYGGGESGNLLHPDFSERADIHELIQRRHLKGNTMIDEDGVYHSGEHEWKVPYGVRIAMRERLVYGQIAVKYPFYVTWVSPKTGKRHKKYVSCMIAGIHLIATRIQYHDPNAALVSRTLPYYIPPKLRGKFPRKMGGKMMYWCPCCMAPRRFRRVQPLREFYALKKVWSDEKARYVWVERKLAVLQCAVCGITNQDQRFRSSNQPYEVRRIKQGVRRVKRRRRKK